MRKNKLKIDKRIEQVIEYGANKIKISEENYNNLKEETKNFIKLNDVKIIFDNKEKNFKVI